MLFLIVLPVCSAVDTFDSKSIEQFPLINKASYLEVDQLAGELMIIPTGWFHQVFNCEETIAVSGQMTNVNNYRVVLEEILKLESNLKRNAIPPKSKYLHPSDQVNCHQIKYVVYNTIN